MPEEASKASGTKADVAQRWGGCVPIVIGATGHRNIPPADGKLAAALRGECRKLRKQYKSSPFVVLSALAEGADRLIAQTAIEELQADLIAVLPMPAEDYERDFFTEDSKTEFRAFLDRAVCVKTAALEGDAWRVDGDSRNGQYARAGSIIVEHAQVLFALWDGKEARGLGGTAEQVMWFERGYAPNEYSLYKDSLSPLAPLEPGLRICIAPGSAQVSKAVAKQPLTGKSDIEAIMKRTDRYNRNIARNRDAVCQSERIVAKATDKAFGVTESVFQAANGLSISLACKVRWSDAAIFLLAMIAVAAFNLVSNSPIAPWVYFTVTALMALLAGRVRFLSVDNRFLEYRCLAEAMRTLFFWRGAGIARPVWIPYLSRQAGVVHWLRHAVRTIEFVQDCLLSKRNGGSIDETGGIAFAKTAWVEHQKVWFLDKELEYLGRLKIWKAIELGAFAISFAMAAALAAMTVMPHAGGEYLWDVWVKPKDYGDLWQVALGLFTAGGLAARGFRSRRAYLELAKQYASQRQIFETASRMLDDPASGWEAKQILEKLGDEALQEQAEWVWLGHTRPFEMPVP